MINKGGRFLLILFIFCNSILNAQIIEHNPYSRLGIGELNTGALVRNLGMGGIGVGAPGNEYINHLNPALLSTNKKLNVDSTHKFTMFEAGAKGVARFLANSNEKYRSMGGNFNYFHFVFPVSRRWSTSAGIEPYSQMNYEMRYGEYNSGQTVEMTHSGRGGIYKAHFSNGVDITRNLSFGLQTYYLFGNLTEESVTRAFVSQDEFRYGMVQKTFYSGGGIKPGVSYRGYFKRDSLNTNDIFFTVGATADLFFGTHAERTRTRTSMTNLNQLVTDTVVESMSMNFMPPPAYRIGFSIDKPRTWLLGADFAFYNWQAMRNFDNDNMQNAFTVAIGGEYLLPYTKDGNKNQDHLKRKTVRMGLSYSRTPYVINGERVNDFSVSVGGSLPIGRQDNPRYRSKPLNKINWALVAGQRGNNGAGLVRDRYIQLHLGLLITEKWFEVRRID
ncbi:MAG: hypothetical protein ACK40G_07245 [Cytophagaceae bacterium]